MACVEANLYRTDAGKFNHRPSGSVVLAVLGTLSLEFTRLAQLTGDDKYYDAVQKVMDELEKWQDSTALPGMWPAIVKSDNFNQTLALTVPYVGAEEQYTLGALADSAYEYLPKQYMMLGGQVASYRTMYEKFIKVARKHLFFRPMTVGDEDILIAGTVNMVEGGTPRLTPELQHLTCFAGGMLAIAGKIFNRPEDVVDGGKLADGCVWAYRNTITGIMPETLTAVPCDDRSSCPWDSKKWYDAVSKSGEESAVKEIISKDMLSPGFARVGDARYLLRFDDFPPRPLTGSSNQHADPKPSNPSSSCTASPATPTGARAAGPCSSRSEPTRRPLSRTRPSAT